MILTQSAVEKHIIYLMHFFLALISPSIPPLTKSIFGEHAIIISIHWIVMDLNGCYHETVKRVRKRKRKILSRKGRINCVQLYTKSYT